MIDFENIFEPELLQEIKQKGVEKKIEAGETIINYGDLIRQIPLIVSGSIKVSRMNDDGQELFLYYVHPNESCAMSFSCCLMQRKSEIKAVAEEDIDVIMIPNKLMDEWMMKYASWKSFVMLTFQTRFDELLKTIDSIAFQQLDERLIHLLKEKKKLTGSAVIHITHQQIADELATSRVVISRLLKQLENQKKLLLYRHEIKLLKDL
ncbi:MAG: hypothetical protein RJA07_2299 [Bacteroidota bacterium]|jgi:CRP/FNR family transcriptional regulator